MNDRIVESMGHHFAGHEVSWAGYCPWTGEACFGSEDGKLFLPKTGPDLGPEMVNGLDIFDDEAINGIAFSGNLLAISCRTQVVVGKRGDSVRGVAGRLEPSFNGGSHGVVAGNSGGFIAPLGRGGLLFMSCVDDRVAIRVGKIDREPVDFYKLISLGAGPDGEVFACAARTSGLLAFTISDDVVRSPIIGHRLPGIDIVDVCSLNSIRAPHAAAALARDSSLMLTMNVLEEKPPLLISYAELTGTPYSILSADGHVFILTSSELVTFPDLAADFLNGAAMDRPRNAFVMPIQAADAFLVGDESIFVVAENGAFSLRVADLVIGIDGRQREVVSVATPAVSFVPSISNQMWSTTAETFIMAMAA